jgi:hypothetical protein
MTEETSKTPRSEPETTDTIRFQVPHFSRAGKKAHSDKKRDSRDPNVLWRVKGERTHPRHSISLHIELRD